MDANPFLEPTAVFSAPSGTTDFDFGKPFLSWVRKIK